VFPTLLATLHHVLLGVVLTSGFSHPLSSSDNGPCVALATVTNLGSTAAP